jgi:hypothetical protein
MVEGRGAFARGLPSRGACVASSAARSYFGSALPDSRAVDALARALDGRENRVEAIRIQHELLEPFIAMLARSSLVSRSKYWAEAVGLRQEVAALREEAIGRDGGAQVHGNLQRRLVERFLHVGAQHVGEERRASALFRARAGMCSVLTGASSKRRTRANRRKRRELHSIADVRREVGHDEVADQHHRRLARVDPAPGSPASSTRRDSG